MSEDIFRHADRSLLTILTDVSKEFQNLSTTLGFDKLNVMETRKRVNAMYARMDAFILKEYIDICRKSYRDARREARSTDYDFDAAEFVQTVLKGYNTLTDFVYTREWERKRDRLFESIIATETGNQDMRRNLKRGLDVLARQIRQYADIVTTEARLRALKDAGVDALVWITEKDERVCPICRPRDEQIYPIELFPTLPAHWNCRCTAQLVSMEEDAPRRTRTANGFKQYLPA